MYLENPFLSDYPVQRGEERSCLGVRKIWDRMEAELGNKKLEFWKNWLGFLFVPYKSQSCFQGGFVEPCWL